MKHALLLLLFAVGVGAQIPTILNTPVAPSQQEQADLMKAVTDGATSAMDLVRA